MDIPIPLQGVVIGFSIAAPVGPIGVLCIRRTLADGRAVGLLTGLGAATADAVYGCIAAFGLTFISDFLVGHQTGLRLVGGAFLCYLGFRTLRAAPCEQAAAAATGGLLSAYASTFLLTLTNPMTIISFAAVFAGLGLAAMGADYAAAGALVLGVFAGSALWWLGLSAAVGLFRTKVGVSALRWVNLASGLIISAFGLAALWSIV